MGCFFISDGTKNAFENSVNWNTYLVSLREESSLNKEDEK